MLYCTGFQQSAIYQSDGNADTANLVPFQGMLEYFIGSPIAYYFEDVDLRLFPKCCYTCTGFQQTSKYQVHGNADTANLIPFQGMLNISLLVL